MKFIKYILLTFLFSPSLAVAEFPQDFINAYKLKINEDIPVNIGNLLEGRILLVDWAGNPVSIYHWTNEDKELLMQQNNDLADPKDIKTLAAISNNTFNKISEYQKKVTKYAHAWVSNNIEQ